MTIKASANWRLVTSWAVSEADLHEAQELRYRIFVGEMGARLLPSMELAIDRDVDYFDEFCDHLLVHAVDPAGNEPRRLVGTYRLLRSDPARRAGGYSSEKEFDLDPIRPIVASAVELGRACVDVNWRTGGVIMALWNELGRYMLKHQLDTMFGCASIGLSDGGLQARHVWQHVRSNHLALPQWRLSALQPLERIDEVAQLELGPRSIPPLIKGYLRCGAKVLGPPSVDQNFNTADLPIMLRLQELSTRYREQFLNT